MLTQLNPGTAQGRLKPTHHCCWQGMAHWAASAHRAPRSGQVPWTLPGDPAGASAACTPWMGSLCECWWLPWRMGHLEHYWPRNCWEFWHGAGWRMLLQRYWCSKNRNKNQNNLFTSDKQRHKLLKTRQQRYKLLEDCNSSIIAL